jgi:hypothetical protein
MAALGQRRKVTIRRERGPVLQGAVTAPMPSSQIPQRMISRAKTSVRRFFDASRPIGRHSIGDIWRGAKFRRADWRRGAFSPRSARRAPVGSRSTGGDYRRVVHRRLDSQGAHRRCEQLAVVPRRFGDLQQSIENSVARGASGCVAQIRCGERAHGSSHGDGGAYAGRRPAIGGGDRHRRTRWRSAGQARGDRVVGLGRPPWTTCARRDGTQALSGQSRGGAAQDCARRPRGPAAAVARHCCAHVLRPVAGSVHPRAPRGGSVAIVTGGVRVPGGAGKLSSHACLPRRGCSKPPAGGATNSPGPMRRRVRHPIWRLRILGRFTGSSGGGERRTVAAAPVMQPVAPRSQVECAGTLSRACHLGEEGVASLCAASIVALRLASTIILLGPFRDPRRARRLYSSGHLVTTG